MNQERDLGRGWGGQEVTPEYRREEVGGIHAHGAANGEQHVTPECPSEVQGTVRLGRG